MNDQKTQDVAAQAHQFVSEKTAEAPGLVAARYETPRVVDLGTATGLIRQNITGQLRDGTGGWYVWGS